LGVRASDLWSGAGANSYIDAPANWGGVNPIFDGSQTVTFGTGGADATIETPVSFVGIIFDANTNFLINGSSILTDYSAITAGIPGTTPHTYAIGAPVVNAGDQTWNITNNGISGVTPLILSNSVTGGATATIPGDGTLIFAGTNSTDNDLGINVTGGGLVVLQGTGGGACLGGDPGDVPSYVTDGTLKLNGGAVQGQCGPSIINVTNIGVFDFNGQTDSPNLIIANDGTGQGVIINSSTNPAVLVSTAIGMWWPECSIGGPGNITFAGGVACGNNRYIYKLSTNTLTVTGTSPTVGGTFVVENGTLVLSTSNNVNAASQFIVTNGTVQFAGQNNNLIYPYGLNYVTNAGVLDLNGTTNGSMILHFGGTNGAAANGALINSSSTTAVLLQEAKIGLLTNTVFGGPGNIIIQGYVNGYAGGNNTDLIKTGSGTLTFTSIYDNTSLGVTVQAGTLFMDKDTSSGYDSSVGGPGLVVSGGTAQLGLNQEVYSGANVTATNVGVFDLNGNVEANNVLTLGGAGSGSGALINSSANASTMTVNNIVLTAPTTVGGTGNIELDGSIFGTGSLTKVGNNTLNLTGDSTNFTGNTIISAGTLALTGNAGNNSGNNCIFTNTPLISVGNGATFDTSGLYAPPFVFGAGQTLSNSASSTGILNGNMDVSGGAISVSYTAGTPALTVHGGTLNVGSGTVVNVNNTGAQLASGNYTLISNGGGTVIGTAPSAVTVGGSGAAAAASLQIDGSGNLKLVVASSAPTPTNIVASVSGNQLVLNWPSGQGWQLQAQTNSLTGTWFNVVGATPPWTITIDPANSSVFYRLMY
jgi:autotransporter-associated beta strand protein